MRKPSKTTLRNKLDKICSQIVRARGICASCLKKENLQCCHIYSRTYNATRWDLDNLLCLCASCHFYFHKNPLEFANFVKEYCNDEKLAMLHEARNQITKYTTEDLEIKLKILTEMAEGK